MGKSKFGNITDLQADESLEQDGIDLAFGNGRVITVARSGATNRKYKASMSKAMKPYMSTTGVITGSDDEVNEVLYGVYAESIVIGWKGFTDEKGVEIPFTKENCIELFNEAPEIFEIVRDESAKFSNFARRDVEDAGKG